MDAARRVFISSETIGWENGRRLDVAITRAAGMMVVSNMFAGKFAEDLSPLFELGRQAGQHLSGRLTELCPRPVISYGKAAIVGIAGEMEHGGACIHPMLGKPMRAAIGGGEAVIPSNVKIASAGASIDVPLGHKDNAWSFDHFDTMTLSVPDAPLPDEIVVMLAFADGGRPMPRCGSAPR